MTCVSHSIVNSRGDFHPFSTRSVLLKKKHSTILIQYVHLSNRSKHIYNSTPVRIGFCLQSFNVAYRNKSKLNVNEDLNLRKFPPTSYWSTSTVFSTRSVVTTTTTPTAFFFFKYHITLFDRIKYKYVQHCPQTVSGLSVNKRIVKKKKMFYNNNYYVRILYTGYAETFHFDRECLLVFYSTEIIRTLEKKK